MVGALADDRAAGEQLGELVHGGDVILLAVERNHHRGIADVEVHVARRDDLLILVEHATRRREADHFDAGTLGAGRSVLRDEEIIPASYMNFYIGNAAVVVPLYGAENDAAAVEAIGALFPGRKAIGFRADHVLTGGGSFHCISQQVPK